MSEKMDYEIKAERICRELITRFGCLPVQLGDDIVNVDLRLYDDPAIRQLRDGDAVTVLLWLHWILKPAVGQRAPMSMATIGAKLELDTGEVWRALQKLIAAGLIQYDAAAGQVTMVKPFSADKQRMIGKAVKVDQ